ncbi:MAG: hypothetical protein ACSLE5_00170 [Porticoccaceae bacterium]
MAEKPKGPKNREQRKGPRRKPDDRREAIRIDPEPIDRREKPGRRSTDKDPWPR